MRRRYPQIPPNWSPGTAEVLNEALRDLAAVRNLQVEGPLEMGTHGDSMTLRLNTGSLKQPPALSRRSVVKKIHNSVYQRRQTIINAAAAASKIGIVKTPNNSISASSTSAVEWATEYLDTNTMVDLGTHPSRITIKTGGHYAVWYRLGWNDTGVVPLPTQAWAWVSVNGGGSQEGSLDAKHATDGDGGAKITPGSFLVLTSLAVNDYLEVIVQNYDNADAITPSAGQFGAWKIP